MTELALGLLALCTTMHAVVPAPDGGYPGYNTAEGQNALFSRTTGVWNTALGAFTLYSDTSGTGNTAVGINVLRNNLTGCFNTGVGLNALFSNDENSGQGQGSLNCAFGAYALFANITGRDNCAFGSHALSANTGSYNSAFGSGALAFNTTGEQNTATGFFALEYNLGSNNTADGFVALNHNRDGVQNTAIGSSALQYNSSGNSNTAMGFQALGLNQTGGNNTAVGGNALEATSSGSANTALGYGAGTNVTTGSFNVYIGHNVGGVADEVGHTYISNISSTQQNLSPVTIDLNTGLLGHEFSSKRYKEDIKPMDKASEAVFALKPVTYRYKKEIDKSQAVDYGLVAEEVAKVDPNLAVRDRKGQVESLRYNAINVMLLNEFPERTQKSRGTRGDHSQTAKADRSAYNGPSKSERPTSTEQICATARAQESLNQSGMVIQVKESRRFLRWLLFRISSDPRHLRNPWLATPWHRRRRVFSALALQRFNAAKPLAA